MKGLTFLLGTLGWNKRSGSTMLLPTPQKPGQLTNETVIVRAILSELRVSPKHQLIIDGLYADKTSFEKMGKKCAARMAYLYIFRAVAVNVRRTYTAHCVHMTQKIYPYCRCIVSVHRLLYPPLFKR